MVNIIPVKKSSSFSSNLSFTFTAGPSFASGRGLDSSTDDRHETLKD